MKILTDPPQNLWDSYVRSKRSTPGFAISSWRDAIDRSLPVRTVLLAVTDDDGAIRGGLLAYHLEKPRRVLFSVPYGLHVDDADAAATLAAAIRSYCSEHNIARTQLSSGLHEIECPDLHWERSTVLLKLDADEQKAWDCMSGKARNKVRKAEKNAVTVATGFDHIDGFYEAYSSRLTGKGVDLLPRKFFHALAESLGDRLTLYAARKNDQTIAGVMFFYSNDVAAYIYNGCRPDCIPLGVNNLLMWHASREAAAQGIRTIDLGQSSPGSGVYDYKTKQLRGAPENIHYYDMLCCKLENRAPVDISLAERAISTMRPVDTFLPVTIRRSLAVCRAKYGNLI